MRRASPHTRWLSYLCGLVGAALLVLPFLPTAAPAQTSALVTHLAASGFGPLRDALAGVRPGGTRPLAPGRAGKQGTISRLGRQSGTRLTQWLVPGMMAQTVVGLLELVQVQQQQCPTPGGRRSQPRLPVGVQPPTVG